MEVTRPQSALLEGLSRFLITHGACGEGFDVAHPAGLGSGRVSITCRGCGARHDYATATIEIEREISFETSMPPTGEPPPPPRVEPLPAPAVPSPPEQPPRPEPAQAAPPSPPGRLRRFWDSPNATVALVAVAILAAALAAIRIGTGDDEPEPEQGSAPTATLPSVEIAKPSDKSGPALDTGETAAEPAAPGARRLQTRRYALTLPRGWSRRNAGGGLLLQPRRTGSPARVQIYYERDQSLSMEEMAAKTAELLRARNPGAALSAVQRLSSGRGNGFVFTARGPRHSESALALSHRAYRYLVLRRVAVGAPPRSRREAAAIERSFRPR